MTEASTTNLQFSQAQPAKPVRSLHALLTLYQQGHRNFAGSDLRGVTLKNIDKEIKSLDLRDIILTGSNLKGIVFNRSSTLTLKVDLTGADLSNCNLQGADFSNSILDQCNFSNSDLRGANLSGSSCRGSDFINTNMKNLIIYSSTDFTASNFTGTNLSGSYLSSEFYCVNFSGCNLKEATFKNFNAEQADFSNADLRNVELPTPTTVNIQYSYYNEKTKFSEDFDPIAMGMELLQDDNNEIEDEKLCSEE